MTESRPAIVAYNATFGTQPDIACRVDGYTVDAIVQEGPIIFFEMLITILGLVPAVETIAFGAYP